MFLIYLFNFFRGYVIIKVEGYFLERFLNICAHRQILLSDVKHKGSACLTAIVSLRGFRQLRGPAYKTKTRVSIIRKKGAPFFIAKLMRRQALILGFVLFGLIIFFLTTRVWVIDVQGNSNIPTMDILKKLESCGLKYGVQIWSVKPDRLQTSVLARMPELSWLWVTVEGTRAVVEVKERVQRPEMVPQNLPCNIIATKSGIITRLIVKDGNATVKENMAVAQGQLLVSGIIESKVIPARYVRADAQIWAKTVYEYKNTLSLSITKRLETGSKTTRHSITIMGKEYNLYWGAPCPYIQFDSTLSRIQLKVLNNLYLPIVVHTAEYRQVKETQERISPEEAITQGKATLENKLKADTTGGTVDDMKFETANIDDNTISISLKAQCTEQIAKQVLIN